MTFRLRRLQKKLKHARSRARFHKKQFNASELKKKTLSQNLRQFRSYRDKWLKLKDKALTNYNKATADLSAQQNCYNAWVNTFSQKLNLHKGLMTDLKAASSHYDNTRRVFKQALKDAKDSFSALNVAHGFLKAAQKDEADTTTARNRHSSRWNISRTRRQSAATKLAEATAAITKAKQKVTLHNNAYKFNKQQAARLATRIKKLQDRHNRLTSSIRNTRTRLENHLNQMTAKRQIVNRRRGFVVAARKHRALRRHWRNRVNFHRARRNKAHGRVRKHKKDYFYSARKSHSKKRKSIYHKKRAADYSAKAARKSAKARRRRRRLEARRARRLASLF